MTAMWPLGLNHHVGARTAWRGPVSVVLLIALAANIGGAAYYEYLLSELAVARSALVLAAKPPGAMLVPSAADRRRIAAQQAELEHGRESVRASDVPWDALFGALELAGSADVSLLALEPLPEKRSLKLIAEARTMDAALLYLRSLAAAPAFATVSLQSHHVQQDDIARPVRIMLIIEWRAPS